MKKGQPGKDSVSGIDRLAEFEVFCGRAEGKSEKTIELTLLALRKLRGFLEREEMPTDVRLLGVNEIRSFTLYLQNCRRYANHRYAGAQDTTLSGYTVNSYLRALRAAWNRWVAEGLVESSPFQKVKIPKPPRRVINTFSQEQLENLLGRIDTATPVGFRDHLLIQFFLDTACRLTEITRLKPDNVNLQGRTIKILGKGRRERIVPFGVKVQKMLWKYMHVYRPSPQLPRDDYLFLTIDGRPLTKNRVESILKRRCSIAGIKGVRCPPHTLRHTACLLWVRNGGDIFSLQQLTGHSSLTVLRGYVNLSHSDIQDAHHRYSPVDNLDIGIQYRNRQTARKSR